MDMWTTQERCPHAHSLNNKYKSQTISQGLNRPQILRRRLIIVLVILLLGGFGGYHGYNRYGGAGLGGVLGLVLIVILVLWLVGSLHV
jgi:hypothetical protein